MKDEELVVKLARRIKRTPAEFLPGYKPHPGYFYPGNKFAEACNMPLESHQRRMQGLFKTWTQNQKRYAEGTIPMRKARKSEEAKLQRIKDKIAMEARDVQNKCRLSANEVIEALISIVLNEDAPEAARISAGQVLLDRAYGKANQTTINANIDANGKATEVTAAELDARINVHLKRVEELTAGTTKPRTRTRRPINLREFDRDPDSSSIH